ncbi:hypothetical protein QTP86_014548 [Hemibagrus guttatus]|nr:hypothetical protein QTP86_014548 [Hemibagrus guttatus]
MNWNGAKMNSATVYGPSSGTWRIYRRQSVLYSPTLVSSVCVRTNYRREESLWSKHALLYRR